MADASRFTATIGREIQRPSHWQRCLCRCCSSSGTTYLVLTMLLLIESSLGLRQRCDAVEGDGGILAGSPPRCQPTQFSRSALQTHTVARRTAGYPFTARDPSIRHHAVASLWLVCAPAPSLSPVYSSPSLPISNSAVPGQHTVARSARAHARVGRTQAARAAPGSA